jgi:hypothetical protein
VVHAVQLKTSYQAVHSDKWIDDLARVTMETQNMAKFQSFWNNLLMFQSLASSFPADSAILLELWGAMV